MVKVMQDIRAARRNPALIRPPKSAQFVRGDIALFELVLDQDRVRVVEERHCHYRLVSHSWITSYDLKTTRCVS